MKQTVVGLFNKSNEAQQAVQQLVSSGFSNNDIDLSVGSTGTTTDTGNTNFDLDRKDDHESGITRFFKNLFGDDDNDNVTRYSNMATRGTSIVTVHASSAEEAERAADVLDDCGAIDVDDDANNYGSDTGIAPVGMFNETTGATATTPDMDNTSMNDDDITGTKSINVIEEELQVGKRTVETGGVRLKSRIVERPVEESLRLREERVYVNRNPVNRAATSKDFDAFKEGEMELREHAEVPVVSKEARVVEEVTLGKDVSERNETVRDTVRKTEVDVEDLTTKNRNTTSSTDGDYRSGN